MLEEPKRVFRWVNYFCLSAFTLLLACTPVGAVAVVLAFFMWLFVESYGGGYMLRSACTQRALHSTPYTVVAILAQFVRNIFGGLGYFTGPAGVSINGVASYLGSTEGWLAEAVTMAPIPINDLYYISSLIETATRLTKEYQQKTRANWWRDHEAEKVAAELLVVKLNVYILFFLFFRLLLSVPTYVPLVLSLTSDSIIKLISAEISASSTLIVAYEQWLFTTIASEIKMRYRERVNGIDDVLQGRGAELQGIQTESQPQDDRSRQNERIQLQQLGVQLGEVQNDLQQRDNRLQQNEDTIRQFRARLHEVRIDLHQRDGDLQLAEVTEQQLRVQLQRAEDDLQQQDNRLQQNEDVIRQLRTRLHEVRTDLHQRDGDLEVAAVTEQQLRAQLRRAEDDLQQLNGALGNARANLQEVQDELRRCIERENSARNFASYGGFFAAQHLPLINSGLVNRRDEVLARIAVLDAEVQGRTQKIEEEEINATGLRTAVVDNTDQDSSDQQSNNSVSFVDLTSMQQEFLLLERRLLEERVVLANVERAQHLAMQGLTLETASYLLRSDVLLLLLRQHGFVTDPIPFEPTDSGSEAIFVTLDMAVKLAQNQAVIIPIEIAPVGDLGPHLSVVVMIPVEGVVLAYYFDPFYGTRPPQYLVDRVSVLVHMEISTATMGYFAGFSILGFVQYLLDHEPPLKEEHSDLAMIEYQENLTEYLQQSEVVAAMQQQLIVAALELERGDNGEDDGVVQDENDIITHRM